MLNRKWTIKTAVIVVSVAGFLILFRVLGCDNISQIERESDAKMKRMDRSAHEMTLEKVKEEDPAFARKLRQQDKNGADLKQAQEDYDAGHIGLGELHRIQREVRDRESALSP